MKFLLMHGNVVHHDAIGRDILLMYRALSRSYECRVFCEHAVGMDEIPRLDLPAAMLTLSDPQCVAIYHHSIHWPLGERLLYAAAGPIVFKYHNITPPYFFPDVPAYRDKCIDGREQTYRFMERIPDAFWLADSEFNMGELHLSREVPHRIVPPFPSAVSDPAETEPAEATLRELLADTRLRVLFIGRLAPNKGHLFLLDVLRSYKQLYGGGIMLYIIGKHDEALQVYYDAFQEKMRKLDLVRQVKVVGEADSEQVLSYYLGCDVFLCCSEHEGFCVPIVESQCLCLPVVARGRSAVPETMGAGQIVLAEDPAAYAEQLHRLHTDPEYRGETIENGRANYVQRFTREKIEQAFFSGLREAGVPV